MCYLLVKKDNLVFLLETKKSRITTLVVNNTVLGLWCASLCKGIHSTSYTEIPFIPTEMQISWGGAWQFFISIWPYYPASQGRR